MAKTVLIVDDNAFVRWALRELFKRETDIEVCGEAENGRLPIEEAGRLHPDLIVLDLLMPVMNGLDAVRALKRMMPSVPLIMYSAFEDRFSEQLARLAGISVLVSKYQHVSVLIDKARGLLSEGRLILSSEQVNRQKRRFEGDTWKSIISKNCVLNLLNSCASRATFWSRGCLAAQAIAIYSNTR